MSGAMARIVPGKDGYDMKETVRGMNGEGGEEDDEGGKSEVTRERRGMRGRRELTREEEGDDPTDAGCAADQAQTCRSQRPACLARAGSRSVHQSSLVRRPDAGLLLLLPLLLLAATPAATAAAAAAAGCADHPEPAWPIAKWPALSGERDSATARATGWALNR